MASSTPPTRPRPPASSASSVPPSSSARSTPSSPSAPSRIGGCDMPHTHYPTTPDGLVLDVLIGLKAQALANLMAAGQQPPRPLLLRAQIDTASTITCIASRLVAHFSLTSFQGHTTQTVAGSIPVK